MAGDGRPEARTPSGASGAPTELSTSWTEHDAALANVGPQRKDANSANRLGRPSAARPPADLPGPPTTSPVAAAAAGRAVLERQDSFRPRAVMECL
jgi:hypothetical protein